MEVPCHLPMPNSFALSSVDAAAALLSPLPSPPAPSAGADTPTASAAVEAAEEAAAPSFLKALLLLLLGPAAASEAGAGEAGCEPAAPAGGSARVGPFGLASRGCDSSWLLAASVLGVPDCLGPCTIALYPQHSQIDLIHLPSPHGRST